MISLHADDPDVNPSPIGLADARILCTKRKAEESGHELVKSIILQRLRYGLSEKGVNETVNICRRVLDIAKAGLAPAVSDCTGSQVVLCFDRTLMLLEEVKSQYQRTQWIDRNIVPVVR